jgi:hypothetical protein
MEQASPYLTISVSINPNSSTTAAVYTQNPIPTDVNPVAEGDAARPSVQVSGETATAVTATLSPLSRTGDPPIESGALVGQVLDSQTEMSRSLDRAEKAMDTVKAWKSTVGTIKLVMDIIAPIVNVWPISLFSTHRWANFRPSAEPPGQLSMDPALKDPRGVSLPCQRVCDIHLASPSDFATAVQA